MNRRELMHMAAAGLFSRRAFAVQADEPQFSGLDRIEFYVSNVEKSRDFFVAIFGNTVRNRNGKRYVKLGSSYMAFEPPRGNTGQVRVDHFSVSIRNLEMPKLHEFLDRRGVMYQDYPSGRDTAVLDSEGIRTQLSPEDGWSFLNTPNFPAEMVSMKDQAIFRPLALDHVVLNVDDPEKSAAFYQRFLGRPAEPKNDRLWFMIGKSRVVLQQTAAGERVGVHHFGISVDRFDSDRAISKLQQVGARNVHRSDDAPGSVMFQDVDDFKIEAVPSL